MFARSISFRLKPDSIAAFSKLIEDETLSLLRKQKGFPDEITFFVPGGRNAIGIAKESAMWNWLVRLWHRIDRWMHGGKLTQTYHPSNLHGRHR